MANFTIRVELIGRPSEDVYTDLHGRMERGGFSRTIDGFNTKGASTSFALPHATYFGASEANVGAVRDWARDHAREAWGKSIVFVAQTETWALANT
jgi:hypothetical protein